eukprot:357281-Chlamydomonas_euryale.AAC.31
MAACPSQAPGHEYQHDCTCHLSGPRLAPFMPRQATPAHVCCIPLLQINTNPEPWAALKAGSPDWWQPQPTASLDHAHVQTRPSRPLAIALSCRVCGDLLKEATMCSECGHTCEYNLVQVASVCTIPTSRYYDTTLMYVQPTADQ